jgi:DNA invertase Pin-like site-specific DNA recombinase
MGDLFGYTRISTNKQDGEYQRQLLSDAGVVQRNLFYDTFTGTTMNRPGWKKVDALLRKGDTLVITSLWRMGRCDETVRRLINLRDDRGVNFIVLDCEWLAADKTNMPKLIRDGILNFMGYVGEQYVESVKFATKNGMAVLASMDGMKAGAPPIAVERIALIRHMREEGMAYRKIAIASGISLSTVMKYLRDPAYNPAPPRKANRTLAREAERSTGIEKVTIKTPAKSSSVPGQRGWWNGVRKGDPDHYYAF